MVEVMLAIIAGLILFLYAIRNLSDTIQLALGDRAKAYIEKYTSTTPKSLLVGILATTLLDSSSAVIIIAIVLLNSNLMRLRQAMGIVLGANIGTTISSQLIATHISRYSPVLLLIGFLLAFLAKSDRISRTGKVVLYFGVMFFGLYTMENAVVPLRAKSAFTDWLLKAEQPLWGAWIGAMVTLIIQSSSATVGMAIILCKKGLLSLTGGIAIMLGAELGTVSDTLLATIKGSRAAIKTGLFHLIFNTLSIGIGLIFFKPFVQFIEWFSGKASVERALANAHLMFNVLGVLIFVWLLPVFENMLNRLLPDREKGPLTPSQQSAGPGKATTEGGQTN